MPPVFLRPFPRTGGTLMVAMLDAHPALAMSYEIYEDQLVDENGAGFDVDECILQIERAYEVDPTRWIRGIDNARLRSFVARARRGGIEVGDTLGQLRGHRESGGAFSTLDDRLDFIENLMQLRAERLGKERWGGKAKVDPRRLQARHPKAKFLAMLRDGRDVLASQLNVGNFNTTPQRCAEDWSEAVRDFRAFMREPGVQALEVVYEELVDRPEATLRDVSAFLGVAFDRRMLTFDQQDLDLFKNPHGHLSYEQLVKGLTNESIGRWRHDLSLEQLEAFERTAGGTLRSCGYL